MSINNRSLTNGISLPYHPKIRMPGQAHDFGSTTTASSSGEMPRRDDTSGRPTKMPRRTRIQPAASSVSSEPEPRTLKLTQAQWEMVSEDTEKYIDDDTNLVVDCFINAQEVMAELELAIRNTSHREKLGAGVKAANDGLDVLGSDLFRIIKGTIDELSRQA